MLVHTSVPLMKLVLVQYNPWYIPQMTLGGFLNELVVLNFVWKNLNAYLTCVNVLMDISPHTYPPKVTSYHVDCAAYSLVTLGIMEF